MNRNLIRHRNTAPCVLFAIGIALTTHAAAISREVEAESVEVKQISEKYWAQGDPSQLGVVQNRTYSRSGKLGLDLLTGSLSTDPFLSVRTWGATLGWNFNEDWSLGLIAWKADASDSDAYRSFREQAPLAEVDRNPPKGFYGVQGTRSILYGKAALFGDTLIHVDVFVLGGLGIVDAKNGRSLSPFLGIGQKIHLTRNLSLHLDYRILRFSESLIGPTGSHERTNTSGALNLGLGILF